MAFLDRFKKQKEREVKKDAAPAAPGKDPKAASTASKKSEEKATAKKADEKKPAAKKASKPAAAKVVRTELAKSIIAPVITEKATYLADRGQYVFRVDRNANRVQVRRAFKEIYGVMPTRVNIINLRGEPVRFGRIRGKQSGWKKAIVTVPKGKEIQVYEGV